MQEPPYSPLNLLVAVLRRRFPQIDTAIIQLPDMTSALSARYQYVGPHRIIHDVTGYRWRDGPRAGDPLGTDPELVAPLVAIALGTPLSPNPATQS